MLCITELFCYDLTEKKKLKGLKPGWVKIIALHVTGALLAAN